MTPARSDVAARKRATGARVGRSARSRREGALLGVVFVLAVVAAVVARGGYFTAGSSAGYWLGVAGGVAMLLLFLYPMRKHWRFAARWGRARGWFALHMVLGIAGPLLIVLHSTLHFGSLNATVAFASMTLVAASGIVGRYLYSRIHHGLYGQRATLAEFRAEAGLDSAKVHSKLALAPAVEERLERFARRVEKIGRDGLKRPGRFFLLGFAVWFERRACNSEIARLLRKRALAEGWSEAALARHVRSRTGIVAQYLRAAQRLAQFTVFERLFSWWHVLHVPLVYMLVLSAIAHVIAVHMY
jgi:hypothetical protein